MHNKSIKISLELDSFYELDADGRLLYANNGFDEETDQDRNPKTTEIDFFQAIFDCRNADDLRRRFLNFVAANLTTETFTFNAETADKIIPIGITLIRVWKSGSNNFEALFFMHIKPN